MVAQSLTLTSSIFRTCVGPAFAASSAAIQAEDAERSATFASVIHRGQVRTVAGSGPTATFYGAFADGPASKARFNLPAGLALDGKGAIYVADVGNHRIRRIACCP